MDISNWFGLTRGKYFGEPPLYVDKTRRPGMTELPQPTILTWLAKSPFILITSPNFVWAVISVLLYYFSPYDLSRDSLATKGPITYEFLAERLPIWFPLVFGYFSFWHVTLYYMNLASRPFIKDRSYRLDKVVHNIFWTSSGIVIWSLFENVFCYLWSTGRLSYINDVTSFNTTNGLLTFTLCLMGIPVWRSVHFYFAHRFLHYKSLYQQVHSLHHRNTDIEPFSGLCMHPVEHLYYYSCILPSLFLQLSPYAFVWNGVHLLLSPAASHSGYEDHFQSDIFHYLHHRYFECNYAGSDAAFMDIYFGTFKGSFKDEPIARDDAKSTLFLAPTREFTTYLVLSSACVGSWVYVVTNNIPIVYKEALSLVVGFGPVLTANLVTSLFNSTPAKPPMSLAANLFHLLFGIVFCSVPISYTAYLTLKN